MELYRAGLGWTGLDWAGAKWATEASTLEAAVWLVADLFVVSGDFAVAWGTHGVLLTKVHRCF